MGIESFPGYGNMNDWTSMDPAIVSYRQYPSYLQNGPAGPPPPNDMFLQQQQHQGRSIKGKMSFKELI